MSPELPERKKLHCSPAVNIRPVTCPCCKVWVLVHPVITSRFHLVFWSYFFRESSRSLHSMPQQCGRSFVLPPQRRPQRVAARLPQSVRASLLVYYLPIEILLDWKAAARTDENARSKSLARPNLTFPPWPNVLPLGDDRRCCFVAPALVLVARALFCRPPSFFRRRGGQKTQKSPSCGTSVSFVRARAAHGEKNNVSPGSVRMTTLASADVRFPRETEQWRRGRAARWWTVSSLTFFGSIAEKQTVCEDEGVFSGVGGVLSLSTLTSAGKPSSVLFCLVRSKPAALCTCRCPCF